MAAAVLPVDPSSPDPAAVARAAGALRAGRMVVVPTETVYGLAVRADDRAAVAALRAAKGRDGGRPFTLHLPTVEALRARFPALPEAAERLVHRRLPGPLTLVLPDPAGGFTGVRVPDDPVCRAVLVAADCPVLATSVNPSGEPPAVTGADAARFAGGTAAVILDAGPSRLGVASTVVRIDGDRVEVLRAGAVPGAAVLADAARMLLFVCSGNTCRSPLAEALAARAMAEARGIRPGDLPTRGRVCGSAGTSAGKGGAASPGALAEGDRRGLDLRSHRSRVLTVDLVERAHRVFTAERSHGDSILSILPGAGGKVLLLDPGGRGIPDPFGGGRGAYGRAGERIEAAVRARAADGSLEG